MLSDSDRELLQFEEQHPGPGLRKLDQVRRRFDVSAARYFQKIHALCEMPEAEREFPQLVHRTLERVDREARRRHERLTML